MNDTSVEVNKQPNKYVTVTQKKNVSTVTEPLDQLLEVHDPGVAGPPNALSIGTVTDGQNASATITGTPPSQILNLVLPTKNSRHVHNQSAPSTTWTINHTLGGYPSVTTVDSAKTIVEGSVQYISTTQVVVNFSSAFSGYAYLT